MRVHYLQHVPFEGLGSIEPWLKAATLYGGSIELDDSSLGGLRVLLSGIQSIASGIATADLEHRCRKNRADKNELYS